MNAAQHIRNAGIYLRPSALNKSTDDQGHELIVVAERNHWKVVRVYEDTGTIGPKGRNKRPAYNAMMQGVRRREIDLVAAWSVDRLAHSLAELIEFLHDLKSENCDLYLYEQDFDTSTPNGRAILDMLEIFSEFERVMIRERVQAGLNRARKKGIQLGRPEGSRSKTNVKKEQLARKALAKGIGIVKVAKQVGLGVGTVHRIARDRDSAKRGSDN
jgi:DNA invertase Pin-like site-specific DNA recombinase